jgi:plastocyanin
MRNNEPMGMMRRAGGAVLVVAAALLAFGGSDAWAADTIEADPVCCTFAPGPYFQDLGETPDFNNPADSDAPHNVTATKKGPDGGPLFRSASIAAGSTVPVKGTEYLSAGTYGFYCTIHGPSMSGTLTVEGGKGQVVARPQIKVTIPKQSLKKVRKSGRLKVKVKAGTRSSGIALKAKKGSKVLAKSSGLKLSAGAARTVKLKLKSSGRKAIRKGKKVKVAVKGSVAFGKPSSAKRTLR